ncbi:MAG TPA: outer membrane protein assembly factor BamD [Bacteroidales bacterium]|nr:outer membrane protein assembly factor BamD [Bacteroidales bacterium]
MKVRLYIIFLISIAAVSCGEYEKILKSTDYELKKAKAVEYYNAKQYGKATELFSQVIPRFRASAEVEELFWLNAQSFYNMRQYDVAGSYFKSIAEQYPFGPYAEESSFLGALCDYNLAPRAELDQTSSRSAIEGFNLFLTRFPASPKAEEARKYIQELQDRLVEKSYLNARLYYNMKEYKAAITALTNSLKEYSDSKYREEMMFLKLNSLFLYAENSYAIRQKERYQATLDEYFSFMEEFPKSQYSREVSRIYDVTTKYLKVKSPQELENLE